MEFKPRMCIISRRDRKIAEEKWCFICANLIFTEVGGRGGAKRILKFLVVILRSRKLVSRVSSATLRAFYAWNTDTRIIINRLRGGRVNFHYRVYLFPLNFYFLFLFEKHTFFFKTDSTDGYCNLLLKY